MEETATGTEVVHNIWMLWIKSKPTHFQMRKEFLSVITWILLHPNQSDEKEKDRHKMIFIERMIRFHLIKKFPSSLSAIDIVTPDFPSVLFDEFYYDYVNRWNLLTDNKAKILITSMNMKDYIKNCLNIKIRSNPKKYQIKLYRECVQRYIKGIKMIKNKNEDLRNLAVNEEQSKRVSSMSSISNATISEASMKAASSIHLEIKQKPRSNDGNSQMSVNSILTDFIERDNHREESNELFKFYQLSYRKAQEENKKDRKTKKRNAKEYSKSSDDDIENRLSCASEYNLEHMLERTNKRIKEKYGGSIEPFRQSNNDSVRINGNPYSYNLKR